MIYLINYINSAGMDGGRETVPIIGPDPDSVTKAAYERYSKEFEQAKEENLLDNPEETLLSYDSFKEEMDFGFKGFSNLVFLNLIDWHIQFEAFFLETQAVD